VIRVGLGFDVHPFGGDGPLVLGGVEIDGPGLSGHSDADVVSHAVADALLGPVGLPDLGSLFPATDEQYRDASSVELLNTVTRKVAGERWWVVNVDVVIAAEEPVLAPHLSAMQANLVRALEPARRPMGPGVHVSLKPKRGEGLGFVGRTEGIAAWAVALLELA
jgi:2-C-methyl-D-erythritol 2,4-cyclodiphosphate synthase